MLYAGPATETIRLISQLRDGEKRGAGGSMEVGEEGDIYKYLSIHRLSPLARMTDSCIKMGSNKSHFSVSLNCEEHSHKTVSTDRTFDSKKKKKKKKKGQESRSRFEPRTRRLLFTSLTPYR